MTRWKSLNRRESEVVNRSEFSLTVRPPAMTATRNPTGTVLAPPKAISLVVTCLFENIQESLVQKA